MCDRVTAIIRRACEEPFFGAALIDRIVARIRHRLEVDPQPTITFELFCGKAEPINIKATFLRQDWEHLLSTLEVGVNGTWSKETLLYSSDLFHACANAAENEVLVVFW